MVQFDNCVKFFNNLILNELYDSEIETWVAGGAVRDYFLSIPISSDVDLYFPNKTNFDKCLKHLKLTKGEIYFENEKVIKIKRDNLKLDLVKTFFQNPQLTIEAFDFTVCCGAVDKYKVYNHPTFFIDLAKKQLMINKLLFPISTIWRLQKYGQKGFRICKQELTKIVEAIQNAPKINNSSSLEIEFDAYNSDSSIFMGID